MSTHPTATQQGAADGFFLLLPQRQKPEAPAGTAGLDWDAYSGAQMLAFGRDCSDAAIATHTLRASHGQAPATQQAGKCMGPLCMASSGNGYAHSRECIDEAAETQGWKPTAEDYAKCGPSTAPQPVEREPLTDEQIHVIYDEVARREPYAGAVTRRNIVRAIEAAHGIKIGGQHGAE